MVREIARIEISPDNAAAFEAAAAQATTLFRRARGCNAMELLRSHEMPGRYWLMVEWRTVEDHEAFRSSPDFAAWRALVSRYFVTAPGVEHGIPLGVGF